jgi:protein-tyrosine phosphatase
VIACVRGPRYGSAVALTLGLVNAANARDLGGYATADGRRVRRGLVYRANALNRLTDADVELVRGLGLACLVDFRHQTEIELVGANRLPTPPPGRVIGMPLFDPDHDVVTKISAALRGRSPGGAPMVETISEPGAAADGMTRLYRWFASAPAARQVFADALKLIATPGALPLLFHCTAGKDRTGWLAALLLSALGVERSTVVEDYLRTNELNAKSTAYLLKTFGDRVPDPAVLLPLFEARREYLDAALAEVDRYGGIEPYLTEALGLDDAVVAALRDTLLD